MTTFPRTMVKDDVPGHFSTMIRRPVAFGNDLGIIEHYFFV